MMNDKRAMKVNNRMYRNEPVTQVEIRTGKVLKQTSLTVRSEYTKPYEPHVNKVFCDYSIK